MTDAFSGAASAQRINQSMCGDPLLLHRVDASKLESPIHIQHGRIEEQEDEEPMNRRDLILLSLYWLASCVLVGLAFYGAANLAKVMQ